MATATTAMLLDSPSLGTRRVREQEGAGIPARKRLFRRDSKDGSSMYRSAFMDFGNDFSKLSLAAAISKEEQENKVSSNKPVTSKWLNFTAHGLFWSSTTIRKSFIDLVLRRKSAEVMGIDASQAAIEYTDHIVCIEYLESVLRIPEYKIELIDELLHQHYGQVTIWVHFVSAVLEMKSTKDWKKRQQKSRVIMNLFVIKGSKYRLSGIQYGSDAVRMVIRRRFSAHFLSKLMAIVEKELLKHSAVVEFLRNLHDQEDIMSMS
jgi:hypothetical protein